MAKNDPQHPEIARASQDVEPIPKNERSGSFHFGRGGAANVANAESETEKAGENGEQKTKPSTDKGKAILQKMGVAK